MIIALVWIVFAILIAAAANSRGRSGFGWFLLAVVISPLLAGLFLLLLPNLTTQALLEEIAAAQGSPTAMARIEQRAEASRTRRIAIPILALLAVAYATYALLGPTVHSPIALPVVQSTDRPKCTIEPFQKYPEGCAYVRVR